MPEITITLHAKLADLIDIEYDETIQIPPAYDARDILQLFNVSIENIGWHALRENGHETPLRDAFLGNDAKIVRLEVLTRILERDWGEALPASFLDRLREIPLVDAREALARWGSGEPAND